MDDLIDTGVGNDLEGTVGSPSILSQNTVDTSMLGPQQGFTGPSVSKITNDFDSSGPFDAREMLNRLNPVVVGHAEAVADHVNGATGSNDVLTAARNGVHPLDRVTEVADEANRQKADNEAKAKLDASRAQWLNAAQHVQDTIDLMPHIPAPIKAELSQPETIMAMVAGLLGGSFKTVGHAIQAATLGAQQRAQYQNQMNQAGYSNQMGQWNAQVTGANHLEDQAQKMYAQDNFDYRDQLKQHGMDDRLASKLADVDKQKQQTAVHDTIKQFGTNLQNALKQKSTPWDEADQYDYDQSISKLEEILGPAGISPGQIRAMYPPPQIGYKSVGAQRAETASTNAKTRMNALTQTTERGKFNEYKTWYTNFIGNLKPSGEVSGENVTDFKDALVDFATNDPWFASHMNLFPAPQVGVDWHKTLGLANLKLSENKFKAEVGESDQKAAITNWESGHKPLVDAQTKAQKGLDSAATDYDKRVDEYNKLLRDIKGGTFKGTDPDAALKLEKQIVDNAYDFVQKRKGEFEAAKAKTDEHAQNKPAAIGKSASITSQDKTNYSGLSGHIPGENDLEPLPPAQPDTSGMNLPANGPAVPTKPKPPQNIQAKPQKSKQVPVGTTQQGNPNVKPGVTKNGQKYKLGGR